MAKRNRNIEAFSVGDAARAAGNYARAGMLDSAQAIADRGGDIDPDDARIHAVRGDMAMLRGNPLEAMTWRRLATIGDPESANLWYLTADAALEASHCAGAVIYIGRLRELDPQHAMLSSLDERATALGCR